MPKNKTDQDPITELDDLQQDLPPQMDVAAEMNKESVERAEQEEAPRVSPALAKVLKISDKMEKICKIERLLYLKRGEIGNHLAEATDAADTLALSLKNARIAYKEHLQTGKNGDTEISDKEAGEMYIAKCGEAIDKAMPVLKRDLGWGEYLKNMLISLANAVISVGYEGKFFTQSKSVAQQAVEQLRDEVSKFEKDENEDLQAGGETAPPLSK